MQITITEAEAQVIMMALNNDDPPSEIAKLAEIIKSKIKEAML